ncbi:hypothetical protein J2W40_003992 [Sphingobium xenophagum]|uniref:Uncharacterized protein n=1 Tax=Sphingobium xenophagum TaxID=121428 RepID=A0ABU1X6E1_SPHXE|nr:hypothetical protein [Sphingobium xenophagum]
MIGHPNYDESSRVMFQRGLKCGLPHKKSENLLGGREKRCEPACGDQKIRSWVVTCRIILSWLN